MVDAADYRTGWSLIGRGSSQTGTLALPNRHFWRADSLLLPV